MKSFLLTSLMAMFAIFSAIAQQKVYVQIEPNGAEYESMSIDDMLEKGSETIRQHWDEIVHSLRNAIATELNDNNKGWVFGYEHDATYMVTFILQEYSENGRVQGHVVVEYYRPGYHKLFFDTPFNVKGSSTRHFTRFSPKTFRKAASQVKSLLIKRLEKERKAK